jgi:hypothetical protein
VKPITEVNNSCVTLLFSLAKMRMSRDDDILKRCLEEETEVFIVMVNAFST